MYTVVELNSSELLEEYHKLAIELGIYMFHHFKNILKDI